MPIEIVSVIGAMIGASMSSFAMAFSLWQKQASKSLASNSQKEDPQAILENASRDIRDLQLQIQKLEALLQEKRDKNLQKA